MSSYSLDILDSKKYHREFEENILYSFDQYIYKKNFRLGEGIKNEDELKHNLIFYRILCEDNCEIVNYIQDKIEGKLDKKIRKRKHRKLSETVKLCAEQECCSDEEATQKLYWTSAIW